MSPEKTTSGSAPVPAKVARLWPRSRAGELLLEQRRTAQARGRLRAAVRIDPDAPVDPELKSHISQRAAEQHRAAS